MESAAEQISEPIEEPYRLRSGSFTVQVVSLGDLRSSDFFPWLKDKVKRTPYFLDSAPIVIDLGDVPPDNGADLPMLAEALKACGLVPVGVQNGSEEQYAAAAKAGLGVFPLWRAVKPRAEASPTLPDEPEAPLPHEALRPATEGPGEGTAGADEPLELTELVEPESASIEPSAIVDAIAATPTEPAEPSQPPDADAAHDEAAEPEPAKPMRSLLVTEPIRSGRQVYAEGGDLIVLSKVSAGAEIKADGNIHVYGTLHGRAFAGVKGDRDAQIFCRNFRAELVSIAGEWRVRDDIDEELVGGPVRLWLTEDRLMIERDE